MKLFPGESEKWQWSAAINLNRSSKKGSVLGFETVCPFTASPGLLPAEPQLHEEASIPLN